MQDRLLRRPTPLLAVSLALLGLVFGAPRHAWAQG